VCASAEDAVRWGGQDLYTHRSVPVAAYWGWDANGLLYERHKSGTIAI
jgi:hypothetical protein